MNRIPTEGLKPHPPSPVHKHHECLNEQNPDRGIETTTDPYQPADVELLE